MRSTECHAGRGCQSALEGPPRPPSGRPALTDVCKQPVTGSRSAGGTVRMLAGWAHCAVLPGVPWPSQAVPRHPVCHGPATGTVSHTLSVWVLARHCMNGSTVSCAAPSCRSSCLWPWSGTWDPWLPSQVGSWQPAWPRWHTPAASSACPPPQALLAPAGSVPLWELSVQLTQQPQSRTGLSHAPPLARARNLSLGR